MSLYNSYISVSNLHLHCPFLLIGPYIHLRIFLSNASNLFSVFCKRDHVSHPYVKAGLIMVLYICISSFYIF
jgi:hypothetical protein